MEAVRDAFLSGYNKASLTQMMRLRLDRDLFDIVGDGPLKNIVFDLLDLADQEGWDATLIREAYRFNPGNDALLQVYEKYGIAPKIELGMAGVRVKGVETNASSASLQKIIRDDNPTFDIDMWRTRLTEIESRVCRVDIDGRAAGTGFLVGPDTLITNYHVVEGVIKGTMVAASVSCLFDYKVLSNGKLNVGERHALAADQAILSYSPYSEAEGAGTPDAVLPTPAQLDFALLRLDGAVGNEPINAPRGFEVLPKTASAFRTGQGLIIAQHPAGSPMKLAIDTQSVVSVNTNQTRVRYKTNTEGGSSGSPVFDMQWNLAALHHFGDPDWKSPVYNQGIAPLNLIRALIDAAGLGALLG
ncbi:MAG: hypothetical protein JWR15_2954 [Prosthecobacter sp.]|nr:hypothetical protein [Prosthecobacter sp.]